MYPSRISLDMLPFSPLRHNLALMVFIPTMHAQTTFDTPLRSPTPLTLAAAPAKNAINGVPISPDSAVTTNKDFALDISLASITSLSIQRPVIPSLFRIDSKMHRIEPPRPRP